MEEKHAAIIRIDKKVLLKVLDFEGGEIHRVYEAEQYFKPDYICIVLEHPDLPAVREGEWMVEITPIMQVRYGEDGSLLGIERESPEKGGAKV